MRLSLHKKGMKRLLAILLLLTIVLPLGISGSAKPSTVEAVEESVTDVVAQYNLYDLAGKMSTYLGPNVLQYLGTTDNKTNFSIVLDVAAETAGEQVYYIGKESTTNVADETGYAIQVWPRWEGIAICKGTVSTENVLASGSIPKATGAHSSELEYGIIDIRDDAEAIIGRKIYVKYNGTEVASYVESNLEYAVGKNVWAYAGGQEGAGFTLKCNMDSFMDNLVADSATEYNLFDLAGKFSTYLGPNVTQYLGETDSTTNVSVLLDVDAETPGETVYYIGKESATDVTDATGYAIQVWPRWEGINIYKGTVATDNLLFTGSIPQATSKLSFKLEFGIVDMRDDEDNIVGRKIYAKYNGEEKVAYFESNLAYAVGKHVWAYASVAEGAGASLKCDMTSVLNKYKADSATEYNLFDLAGKFSTYLGPNVTQYLGAMGNTKNVSVVLDADAETPGEIVYYIGKNSAKNVADKSGYAIQVWPRWGGISIYKGTIATENLLVSGSIPNATAKLSYTLEFGIVDMRDEVSTIVGRKIYAKYNGEEVVACLENDLDYTVSKHVWAYASGAEGAGVSLVCDTNGILKADKVTQYTFEKLTGNDVYGPLGHNITYLLGVLNTKSNVSFKFKVNAADDNEYVFALAKESADSVYDGTGYQFKIRPATGQFLIYQENNDWRVATVDCTIPKNYELEIGLRDMRDRSGKLWGRTVYAKIDGKEVISYLDFDLDHKLGTNVLLRTGWNGLTLMDSNYILMNLPISYVVNGKKQSTTEWMTANTEVVIGKGSYITLTKKPTLDAMPQIQAVYLNGKRIDVTAVNQNRWRYMISNPKKTDKLVVELTTKKLTSDAPSTILDLYDTSGKTEITVGQSQDVGLGLMMKDGKLYNINSGVRFTIQFPQEAVSRLRIGWNADEYDVWNHWGYTIEFNENLVKFMFGRTEEILNSNTCELIKPGAKVVVEIGTVKCYEAGVYTYNRHYVKVGTSVNNLKLVTWYDSTSRGMYFPNVIARGSDSDFTYYISTTKKVVSLEDVSSAEHKNNIGTYTDDKGEEQLTVYYPKTVVAGEPAKIAIYTEEGFKLSSLKVGSSVVTPTLMSDGSYVYQIDSVTSNTKFSYTLDKDNSNYMVTGKDSENVEIHVAKDSVIAAGSTEVQIKVKKGYVLDKILVNGEDYTSIFCYDALEGVYVGSISGIREDKVIEASAVKEEVEEPISSAGIVADASTKGLSTRLVIAIIISAVTLCLVGTGVIVALKHKRRE